MKKRVADVAQETQEMQTAQHTNIKKAKVIKEPAPEKQIGDEKQKPEKTLSDAHLAKLEKLKQKTDEAMISATGAINQCSAPEMAAMVPKKLVDLARKARDDLQSSLEVIDKAMTDGKIRDMVKVVKDCNTHIEVCQTHSERLDDLVANLGA